MLEVHDLAGEAPSGIMPISIRLSLDIDTARASSLLSTLGGAKVSLTIGRETGAAIPGSIDAVAGIEPTPF